MSSAQVQIEAPILSERTLSLLEHRDSVSPWMRRAWLIRRLLVTADLIALLASFVVARIAFSPTAYDPVGAGLEVVVFLVTLPIWVFAAKLYGLYDRDAERASHSTTDELLDIVHLVSFGTWLLFAGAHLTQVAQPDLGRLATFWACAIVFLGTGRASARAIARRRVTYVQNTVVVGAGQVGQLVALKLLRHPEYGLNLVGFVDSEPMERAPELGHVAMLGGPERLADLVPMLDVERVIIAFSSEGHEGDLDLIRSLRDLGVQVDIVPRLFDIIAPGVDVHTLEGLPLIGLSSLHLTRSAQILKRLLDVVGASLVLAVMAPVLAVVALAIRLDTRGPVLFRQTRMGTGGRPFSVLKFRTMVADAEDRKSDLAHLNIHALRGDDRMFKVPNDPRVTRVGRVLRRYFVDELPQLVNVVRGEMSLIGPRPLILAEARHVDRWGRRRLDLKPGMTGLWQVLGRSAMTFEEMVRLDYLYVTTWSLGRDIRLLLRTIPLVLRGEPPL